MVVLRRVVSWRTWKTSQSRVPNNLENVPLARRGDASGTLNSWWMDNCPVEVFRRSSGQLSRVQVHPEWALSQGPKRPPLSSHPGSEPTATEQLSRLRTDRHWVVIRAPGQPRVATYPASPAHSPTAIAPKRCPSSDQWRRARGSRTPSRPRRPCPSRWERAPARGSMAGSCTVRGSGSRRHRWRTPWHPPTPLLPSASASSA